MVMAGSIVLSALGLRFQTETAAWIIPAHRLIAAVPEGEEERIILTDPEQPGLRIFTMDLSLLECQVTPALVKAREDLSNRMSQRELKRRLSLEAADSRWQ